MFYSSVSGRKYELVARGLTAASVCSFPAVSLIFVAKGVLIMVSASEHKNSRGSCPTTNPGTLSLSMSPTKHLRKPAISSG